MSDNDQMNDEERLNDPRHEQVEDNDRNNHTKDENPDNPNVGLKCNAGKYV